MEHKTFPAFQVKLDAAQGIVVHSVAVFGNVDLGDDRIHPGAFVKTVTERSGKIRVLDAHNAQRLSDVIGRPVRIWEVDRMGLDPKILAKYPTATGALMAETQYLMDTPEGAGAFSRIAGGVVDEYSIGYDALDTDYTKEMIDGEEKTIRNIRTVRLWEYSPCIFAMNPATSTLSAKTATGASEGKPYDVFREGDKWRVYKVGEDGAPTGEALGEHDTEEAARNQQRALYVAEGSESASKAERATDLPTGDGAAATSQVSTKAGRVLAARNAARIRAAMETLIEIMKDAGMWDETPPAAEPPDEEEPDGMDSNQPTKQQAGPGTPPTSYGLADIDQALRELQLMEVKHGLQ
jgi:HK97 family phage prohead protease